MFQACVAVNVEIGDMFLRITLNGERSSALTSSCLHVHVGRALLFSFPCRSQRCHDISRIGSRKKIVRTVSHAYRLHLLNLVAERWVPGSVNS